MASSLKSLLERGQNTTFIGAHNPFIAKLIEQAGFGGVYLSGAGLSNSMAVPDTGILKLDDFAYAVEKTSRAAKLPLIADADTGFGDVAKTVERYIKAGAAGLHIEDQQFPKRCGHLPGKEVTSIEEMEDKIKAAVKAKGKMDFIIIARTDARGAVNIEEGAQFDEAVKRGIAYRKAGADAIFPEALRSKKEFEDYRKKVDGPLLANMTEFGVSPFITYEEFFKIGYQIVIFPVSVFRYCAGCALEALKTIKKDGNQKGLINKMMTREEINKLLEYIP